jgi:adenylate kinase family enzyme
LKKIVIMGSSGAGKTTLARELGPILKIKKVIHLDRLFWHRDWKGKSRDTRIDILQGLVREKQWIIEGNYFSVSDLHLNAADTIIFLDTPSLVCLQRIIKRHHEYRGRSRRDIPEGCTDTLTRLRMLKVLAFPLRGRRRLEEELLEFSPEKVIRLHSAKEVEEFLAQQVQVTDDKRNSSFVAHVANEKSLVSTRR